MKKLTYKRKKYLLARNRAELRKRQKRRVKKYIPLTYDAYHRIETNNRRRASSDFVEIIAPKNLRLLPETCEEVLKFIRDIKKYATRNHSLDIRLENVEDIGEGAISMLLSVVEELTRKGLYIKGNKPDLKEPRDILEKSGFFKYLYGKVEDHNKKSKNIILKTGTVNTNQSELSSEIRKSMGTVWGQNGRNPILYGTVFEMMRNSCDHAFNVGRQIMWHIGISHDEAMNLVKFSFVDNGKGIVKSLTEGKLKLLINRFKDNVDIVETAFQGQIQSRTGLSWRGKGLPTIYEAYKENFISNLVVISNNVYIDFDNKIHKKLKYNFKGTYYYWVVDQNCVKQCFT